MSFKPVLPLGGYAGWSFLRRTLPAQQAAQQASAANQREEAYFREKIGKIDTADQLVADKRLLRVALTAFGLEADVNNTAFIRKVLQDGTIRVGGLANRLADKQYQKLSAIFGFGDFSIPRSRLSDFPDRVLTQYRARQFESAIGDQNNTYRLALNAEREIPILSDSTMSETAKWFTVLGSAPIRQVMQTALGLPKSFSSIDIDQQVAVLKARVETAFGEDTVSQFSDAKKMDALVRRYLVRTGLQDLGGSTSPAALALQLLRP